MGSKDRKATPAAQPQCANYWAPLTRRNATRNTGHSGCQNTATRRSTGREERVTVQEPTKKQQPSGPHAHGNTARQVVDDHDAGGSGQQRPKNNSRSNQCNPRAPTTGLRECRSDTIRNTGCSVRQNTATQHSTRREERVTVQSPVKRQQPDGMSDRGGGGSGGPPPHPRPNHPPTQNQNNFLWRKMKF